jgi:WD40 repeat protein
MITIFIIFIIIIIITIITIKQEEKAVLVALEKVSDGCSSAGLYFNICNYIDICTYIYIYVYTYTYIYICMNVCIYICMYTYLYTYIYIHMYTHIYTAWINDIKFSPDGLFLLCSSHDKRLYCYDIPALR